MPRPVGRRRLPAQDIEIAVICANFVKRVLRAVPLVEYLLDHVLAILKPKSDRPFVSRPSGVAVHFQLHLLHSYAYTLQPLLEWTLAERFGRSPHPSCIVIECRVLLQPLSGEINAELRHDSRVFARHSDEIGDRILSSYPALSGADEAPSPLLSRMVRVPYPAQTLAIMGVSKRWQLARNANVVAECGAGKTLIALGSMLVHSAGSPFSCLVMAPPHLVEKWAREWDAGSFPLRSWRARPSLPPLRADLLRQQDR